MSDVFADTHIIIWAFSDPAQLSASASARLATAQVSGKVYISTITFVELTYLVEKRKIDAAVLTELWRAVADPADPIKALPLTLDVARVFEQVPRDIVPDMPDRIIAATAFAHNLPLISADSKIRALTLPGFMVVW